MGDEQIGGPGFPLQPIEQVDHLALGRGVERRDRLVEHQQPGLGGRRSCHRDPLPLPAGELIGVSLQMVPLQADLLEQQYVVLCLLLVAAYCCSSRSAWSGTIWSDTPMSSPAGNGNGSRWQERWPPSPGCWCSTSRSGARHLDPEPGDQPARSAAAGNRGRLFVHRPRSRWSATSRIGSR